MSQQGDGPTRQDDDWWGQLYDEMADDTGPAPAPDSLDDRYASAKRTTVRGPGGAEDTGARQEGSPSLPSNRSDGPAPGRRPPFPAQRGAEPAVGEGAPTVPDAQPGATPTSDARRTPPTAPAPPISPPAPDARAPRPAGPAIPGAPVPPSVPEVRRTPPAEPSIPPVPDAPVPTAEPSAPDPRRATPPAPGRTPAPPGAPDTPAGRPPAVPPMPGWPAPTAEQPPEPRDPGAPRGPVVAGVAHFTPAAPPTPDYVGSRPPTYAPEPTALPAADPEDLGELVPDTVLEGARYGAYTLRAVSLRGDSARYRGEARRDALLVARFGSGEQALVLVAMATGARAAPGAHRAAAEACRWIGQAVGRSHERLVEDLRAGRRGDLKSGLNRLTDRTLGKLRAASGDPTAGLRCLLLPADPDCRTRVFFGAGEGGLFRLRDGEWRDIEPAVPGEGTPDGDRLTMDLGIPVPPGPYEPAEPAQVPFRFRAALARPGDVLMMCTSGLTDPLRGEASLRAFLGRRWSRAAAPGLAGFLADVRTRVKGYADDRTAAAVWEA
ncbi:protein phosphatase 2C domain-containing protein [Streptomyces griseoluteus]|uniref:protein phosphatase 2C domain-containing protein n=1 Tax=Streptomyces griseoluteus TaxID=29306 RepID=UPI0036A3CF3E